MSWLLIFILSAVVLLMSVISLAFTSQDKETPMLAASASVITALIAIAQVNIPAPEILPNDETISSEENIEIRSEWPTTAYYVIDTRKDPKSGEKYTEPIKLEYSATIRAKSRFLWFWSDTESVYYTVLNDTLQDIQDTQNISGIRVRFTGNNLCAGDIISRRSLDVSAICDDGNEIKLNNFIFQEFFANEGDNSVTVVFNDYEATINVIAAPAKIIALEAIVIGADIFAGTTIGADQLDVTAIYSDSHEEKIANYTISPNSPLKVGNNRISISYSSVVTDIIVTAKEPIPKSVYLEDFPIKATARYTGNQGDSFINKIGTRNGLEDTTGHIFSHGLEAWIARWNFTDEISWAWVEYQVDQKYSTLEGTISIISSSYNTGNFNTTVEIIGDGNVLYSTIVTPSIGQIPISVGIVGVQVLRIYVHDNNSVSGGTSFALGDFRISNP